MRKLLLFLTLILAFTSCKKSEDMRKVDPNAVILIRPDKAMKTRSSEGNDKHLSGLEIVKQTDYIDFYSNYFDNFRRDPAGNFGRGFAETQRDYDLPALKMWGIDILLFDGQMRKDFIKGFDHILISIREDRITLDTIAYIPNEVIRLADIAIEKAYNEGNFPEVYALFNDAFTFLPITGEEWRELKEQGLN